MYLARVYLGDAKPREAHALFVRAAERAKSAAAKHEECARPDAAAMEVKLSLPWDTAIVSLQSYLSTTSHEIHAEKK